MARDYGKAKNSSSGDRYYGKAVCKMADGGIIEGLKQGWENIKQGFKDAGDRISAGNIDQPGSEAYNRWGEGSKQAYASEDARRDSKVASMQSEPAVEAPKPKAIPESTAGMDESDARAEARAATPERKIDLPAEPKKKAAPKAVAPKVTPPVKKTYKGAQRFKTDLGVEQFNMTQPKGNDQVTKMPKVMIDENTRPKS